LTKIQVWSLFLGQFAIAGRASCVTKFCALAEDTELWSYHPLPSPPLPSPPIPIPSRPLQVPPLSSADPHGFGPWTEIGQRGWKGRDSTARYGLKLWRNRVDPRFCPQTWLHIAMYAGEHPGVGPIWGHWVGGDEDEDEDEAAEEEELARLESRRRSSAEAKKQKTSGGPRKWEAFTEAWWIRKCCRLLTQVPPPCPALPCLSPIPIPSQPALSGSDPVTHPHRISGGILYPG
jgi:hypothetical protein